MLDAGSVLLRDPVVIEVHVGLGGATVPLTIEPDASIATVQAQLCQTLDLKASAKLMAEGGMVESVEALLHHHSVGHLISATIFKDVTDLSMLEVVEELQLSDDEFRSHVLILSKLKGGSTPRDVVEYLWENQVLLTTLQAKQLFRRLLPLLSSKPGSQAKLHTQLVMALHSFCLEPFCHWEEDGCDDCVWEALHWGSVQFRKGSPYKLGQPTSSCLPDRQDVSRLRDVLSARRSGDSDPLRRMCFPTCNYGAFTCGDLCLVEM